MSAYLYSTNDGQLIDVKDPGKVQNQRVAKLQIVHISILILLVLVKSLFHDSSFVDVDTAL